jgi:hypothetical protein
MWEAQKTRAIRSIASWRSAARLPHRRVEALDAYTEQTAFLRARLDGHSYRGSRVWEDQDLGPSAIFLICIGKQR